jgi:hypothetical protein
VLQKLSARMMADGLYMEEDEKNMLEFKENTLRGK